jgi:hypothetical protein
MELPKNDRDFVNGQPIVLPFGMARRHEPAPVAEPASAGGLRKPLWLVAGLGIGLLAYLVGGATALVILACAIGVLLIAAVGWGIWIMNNVRY